MAGTLGVGSLSVAEIGEARMLWETTRLTASEIAARFDTEARPVTRNAIIGHVSRGKWRARSDSRNPPRTLFDRLAALHEAFNARAGLPPGSGYVRGGGPPVTPRRGSG